VDALSYMLATVRLRTAVYATVWLRPPWGVRIPAARAAAFHAVVSGRCWFRLDDGGVPSLLGIGSPGELPPPAPTPPDVPFGIRRFMKCAQASDARRGS